jgi:hypothetical protein
VALAAASSTGEDRQLTARRTRASVFTASTRRRRERPHRGARRADARSSSSYGRAARQVLLVPGRCSGKMLSCGWFWQRARGGRGDPRMRAAQARAEAGSACRLAHTAYTSVDARGP